ncbi:universal stress family protein [Ralstonia insidiosa]|uniref:Universal stress family protein n=1 Tax=Ralstonia insidiosa TaxID=190721 RepID=A0AAC9BD21_9RALS|nr:MULTISPECIES: universal stress protein [Ralstonia]ANH71490.1 universal stress family protein [Ralstonia insidiosa]EPX96636.1 universal stress protein UspA [Ralstonia sp. AU12-08]MBY4706412.1 universal stress protein [Ralstonia insidiosa]GAQ27460.1 universal stress protein, uspa family [Ralstonia sp. NT80]
MYDTIMVAIDGSPTAQHALDEAIRLAKAVGSKLVIAHVVDNTHVKWDLGALNMRKITETLIEHGHKLVAEAMLKAQQAGVQAAKVTTDDPLTYIDVATELERLALQAGAQAMVLGTHGRRGVRRALLGSVAESVVRLSSLPVLLVR